ncbi:uncharacterized protein LOC114942198 isoform X2 [Nylanderia fulva]|uniref:uncharacterized protein LOC114942198 isoform X2 n=1 Tax=Nylanderia fulva TaxID=613905 RepID=UPI0010FB3885|nr:uncharacterized protein LOC114942198 isoform X2 [Nylanderia fulva]
MKILHFIKICFSSIPRSQEFKEKWIAVIGRNVSKHSKVCSDHFEPHFFHYKINKHGNIQRHLIIGAIPTVEKCHDLDDPSELINEVSSTNENSSDSCESESELVNISNNKNPAVQYCKVIKDVLFPEPLFNADNSENNSISTRELVNEVLPTNEKSDSCESQSVNISNNENSAVQHCRITKDVSSPGPLYDADNSQDKHLMSTKKRKRPADKAATCNKVRTVKFLGDFCPEDFTSPECYNVVRKYLKKHNTRINSLQKQVKRLTKRVENYKDLLSQLRNKDLLSNNAIDDPE